jgi:hypothetical protein
MFAVLLIGLIAGTAFGGDHRATAQGSGKSTTEVRVGSLVVSAPPDWQVVSGSEESQLKSEMKQGIDQMMSRYRTSTGMQHGDFGIRDFKAMRLPNNSGWCILHLVRIPAQTEYYSTMAVDTKQKLDWGLKQGIIERVVESGTVKIGEHTVMKTVVRQKGGVRMITVVHWSPKKPSDVAQLMVLESKGTEQVPKQVDDMLASLKVDDAN